MWRFLSAVFALLHAVLAVAGTGAVVPYLAPAVPAGTLAVELVATPGVTGGVPVVASFGIPFPRGSLPPAALATVRVTDADGLEVPAHVVALTPWRHRQEAALDGTSLRVVLVQVEQVFTGPGARRNLTVHWGGTPRTLTRPTRALRAETAYLVDDAAFPAADGVWEPRVYALLPADWLARGVLRGNRTLPFAAGNADVRDDPATMDAIATWPGYTEAERAMKNNFHTVANRDDAAVAPANLCPFKTAFEPWLYDRPATMFALHFRSGHLSALRDALRNADFYRARVNAQGYFTLNPTDNKYSFNESQAYAYWMTGDAEFLPAIARTAAAHAGTAHAWTPALGFWTERAVAFKLMAETVAWEIDGDAQRAARIDAIVAALAVHQDGAGGQIPVAGRIDGGWYHTGAQHGDWDAAAYGASTWMTALLTDALRRVWVSDGRPVIAQMVRRSGSFLRAALRTQAGQYGGATLAPRYVVAYDGNDFAQTTPIHDEEHALDVAAALAWADWFGAWLGQRDPALAAAVAGVYATYDVGVNFWIRPQGPASGLAAFRVAPWRKWAWEHRTSDGLGWAVAAASGSADLFADGFEP